MLPARVGLALLLGVMTVPAAAQPLQSPRPAPRVIVLTDDPGPPPERDGGGRVRQAGDTGGGATRAEAPPAPTAAGPGAFTEAMAGTCSCNDGPCGPHAWADAEFLSWRVRRGPLPFPLVTTGDPADPVAGALGHPSTRALFGGDGLDYGRAPGFRLTVGGWAGDEPVGGEVSGFWLDSRDINFGTRSDATGSPPVYLPVFNLATGHPGSVVVSDPVFGVAGNLAVHSESRLWGLEANGLAAASRGPVEVTLLAGLRYLDLKESLSLQTATTDLIVFTQDNQFDSFAATNRFYGGQVGARATASSGRWFAGLSGKVAVGATHSSVEIGGLSVQTGDATVPAGAFPGGIYTQPSNIGRHSGWDFSTVSELGVQAGCQVCGCLRAFVGYDVLYWTRVARPGAQIDPILNPSQSPVFFGNGVLSGPAHPAPVQGRSDLCVQGFTAGLEFRY